MGQEQYKLRFPRIMFIDRQLREKRYPNATSLARDWEGISPRTIHRDIAFMRDMLNCPIAYDSFNRGFYYTEENFTLPSMMLPEGDIFHLAVAQKLLENYRGTPAFPAMKNLFEKISGMLPDKVDVDLNWLDSRFEVFQEPVPPIPPQVWGTVFQGLRDTRSLQFLYQALGRGEAIPRTIDPYHAICHRGLWYIIGYCHHRERITIFALSRIRRPKILKKHFEIPPNFSPHSYVDPHRGVYLSQEEYPVAIRFREQPAAYVAERRWAPDQTLTAQEDGSLILRFTTNQLTETARWILSQGSGAQALGPPELVSLVRTELQQALAAYPAAGSPEEPAP